MDDQRIIEDLMDAQAELQVALGLLRLHMKTAMDVTAPLEVIDGLAGQAARFAGCHGTTDGVQLR